MQQLRPKPSSNDSKAKLRRELRAERRNLSEQLRATYDKAVSQHVLRVVKSQKAHSVACFWPYNGEPNLTPAYRQMMADGCELALPIISGTSDHTMTFHSWARDTRLGKNKYGIAEPLESKPISLSNIDMLLMPLVAYDRLGNRMGMGSGYYDRHLEPLRDLVTPLRVGIAYSLQEIARLDNNKWDIAMHGVVNERGWFTFVA